MGREMAQQGRHAEAESFLRRALAAARAGWGDDDPHVASAANNLAEFYRLRRRYAEAEPLYKQVTEALAAPAAALCFCVWRAPHHRLFYSIDRLPDCDAYLLLEFSCTRTRRRWRS